MNKLNIHFMELKNEELSCVLGGGQREGEAVLAGAAGAMSCAPAGPYVIAACAVGGAIYGGFWGYVFGS